MTEASDVPFGLELTKGVVAKFLLAGIGFLGTIVFARVLGPVSFGGYYLVLTIVRLSKLPIDGFAKAGKKRFSETAANRSKIFGAMLLIVICVVSLAGGSAFLVKAWFASYTGLSEGYLLFMVLIASIGLFTPIQGLLSSTGRVSLTIWIDLLRSLFTTPLQLLLVLLGFGAAGMAFGLSIATVCSVPVTFYFLRTAPGVPTRTTLQSLWTYARHSTLSSVFGKAFNQFDLLLLGFLLTPAAAGNYKVAMQLTLPAILISEVSGDGLMARVSNLHSKGKDVGPDLSNTLAFSSILGLPIFFGGLVLARPLVVTIYGGDYARAAPLLIGLAMYRLLRSQTTPLIQTVNGINRPEVNVRISAITLALNVALGIVLTLEYGSIGVVVATAAAESLRYAILLLVVKRQIKHVDLFPTTLLEQLAAAIVMAGVVFVFHQFMPVRSWLHLLGLLCVGGTVYGVVLVTVSETLRVTVLSILRDAGLSRVFEDCERSAEK